MSLAHALGFAEDIPPRALDHFMLPSVVGQTIVAIRTERGPDYAPTTWVLTLASGEELVLNAYDFSDDREHPIWASLRAKPPEVTHGD